MKINQSYCKYCKRTISTSDNLEYHESCYNATVENNLVDMVDNGYLYLEEYKIIEELEDEKKYSFLEYQIRDNHIISLDLSLQEDTKFPKSIVDLKELERLEFVSSGTEFPYNIFRLKNLKFLTFDMPHLTKIPEDITNLKNLYFLHIISYNNTSIPDSISLLRNLKHLVIEASNIASIPENLAKSENLESINFEECLNLNKKSLEAIFNNVKNLKKLKEIIILNCGIEERDLSEFRKKYKFKIA